MKIAALALGTFTLGIAEFVMMGILTMLSADMGVSISTCGHLISAYATGVCVGAGAMVLLAAYLFAGVHVLMPAVVFLGAAALFGSGSPMQSSIVEYSKGGELLGGTFIQISYNLGNAVAAWCGGIIISATGSFRAPSLAGIPLVVVGMVLAWWLYVKSRKQ